jgi:hypothetical protein
VELEELAESHDPMMAWTEIVELCTEDDVAPEWVDAYEV